MRRDLVVEVILDYSGQCENFATTLEAEEFMQDNYEEYGPPTSAWLEDTHGNRKWNYDIVESAPGDLHLVQCSCFSQRLIRNTSN